MSVCLGSSHPPLSESELESASGNNDAVLLSVNWAEYDEWIEWLSAWMGVPGAVTGVYAVALLLAFLPVAHAMASSSLDPRAVGCKRLREREGEMRIRRGQREEYEGERGMWIGNEVRTLSPPGDLGAYPYGSRDSWNGGYGYPGKHLNTAKSSSEPPDALSWLETVCMAED